MSPIGRVFIVLNLILAAGFAVTGGQLLQNQHNYKQLLSDEQDARKADALKAQSQIEQLESERATFEAASTSNQSQLQAERLANSQLSDDIQRLEATTDRKSTRLNSSH